MTFRVLSALSTLAVLFCMCTHSAGPDVAGGSGTETIGYFVDTAGVPVVGATVTCKDSLSLTKTVLTDNSGRYLFDSLHSGLFSLSAYYGDSTLVFSGRNFIRSSGPDTLNLGVDTMRAPGVVRGRVLLDGKPAAGVLVGVGGLFVSMTDDSGCYMVSGLVQGVYSVLTALTNGMYLQQRVDGVNVAWNDTTDVPLMDCPINPDAAVPVPQGLRASYDSLTGYLDISWDGVRVSDLLSYEIQYQVDSGAEWVAVGADSRCSASIRIYSDTLDSAVYHPSIKVCALDYSLNRSDWSDTILAAVTPLSRFRTFFSWITVPGPDDTLVDGREVVIAIGYSNAARNNVSMEWALNTSDNVIQSALVSSHNGVDTLVYRFPNAGLINLYIRAVDECGAVWSDSVTIDIKDSSVIYPRNVWKEDLLPLSMPRRYCSAASLGDSLFVFGGANQDQQNPQMFDALASMTVCNRGGSWLPVLAEADSGRQSPSLLVNGTLLYVAGGATASGLALKTIDVFDPALGIWVASIPVPDSCQRAYPAVCMIGDTIVFVGGEIRESRTSKNGTTKVHAYSLSSGTWMLLGTVSDARILHRVVALNGSLMVLGGKAYTSGTALTTVALFDPRSGVSTDLPSSMNESRLLFGAEVVNDQVYVFGGIHSTSMYDAIASVEVYNPLSGEWTYAASMPGPRYGFASCVSGGQIFVYGGADGPASNLGNLATGMRYIP